MRTLVSRSFEFRANGNAGEIQVSGWSVAEPQHTWSIGKRSILAVDNVDAPHGFFLEIDWQPFTSYPYRLDQVVTITVTDHRISPYRLTARETAAFHFPPPVAANKKILITFDHPDASLITDYFDSADPRHVAIAFRRLRILSLDEPPPARLKNNSTLRVSVEGGQLVMPQPQGIAALGLTELLTQFEMLAGNCDLGLSMRTLGFEQLSLLRFSGATSEVAMRGLENDFEGIGEQLSTEIANNPMKEWLVRDGFGLRFHTHQSSDSMTEAEILKRQRLHIQFLRRKFLEDVQLAEKIFVYADHLQPRTFESALSLFLALNRKGRHRMLWVCPNFNDATAGRVDELVPGLARGSLDLFAAPLAAGHITVSGWVNVLFNASVVFNRGTVKSACDLGQNQ